MEVHLGRLIDHVHLRVRDLEASKRFYRAVLHALGLPIGREGDGWFSADELFIDEGDPPTARLHLAFQAPDRETVHRFHAAALAAGGRDNGAPGERGMMVTPLTPEPMPSLPRARPACGTRVGGRADRRGLAGQAGRRG